jgi:hypothetical protein
MGINVVLNEISKIVSVGIIIFGGYYVLNGLLIWYL